MTSKIKYLIGASGVAVAMLGATPAFAAGTTSGTSITNTATVNYQVGGVSQAAITASNSFTVDRKINLTVVEVGNATTTVAPGSTAQITTFDVTNTSNAPLDFALSVAQAVGGTSAHGGTDNFDVTGVQIFADNPSAGTVGSYDAADTLVYIDELAADATRRVFVLANIPAGQANNSVAEVNLIAQAAASGTTGSQGAAVTETTGANTTGVDTVFADGVGSATGDVARDGRFSDDDDYTVSSATLTVTKQSRIVSDPFNGTTNPKMIPGATLEYCIVVTNAAGGAAATSVNITDPIPSQTTYDSGYGIFQSGTYTGSVPTGTCNLDGTAGGSFSAGTVSGTLGTVAVGTTRTIYFRVTVN